MPYESILQYWPRLAKRSLLQMIHPCDILLPEHLLKTENPAWKAREKKWMNHFRRCRPNYGIQSYDQPGERNKVRKTASLSVVILLVVFLLAALCAAASADVPIDQEHFPDAAFREELAEYYYHVGTGMWGGYYYLDNNRDGIFSDEEIKEIDHLVLLSKTIASLQGIEYFTALEDLDCSDLKLTQLDLSQNSKLTELDCSYNQLTQLDVSHLTALVYLDCDGNQLTQLDLSRNTALNTVTCKKNQLTSLTVSPLKSLTTLNCEFNQLKEMNVSGNENLTTLICYSNQISKVNVSGANNLEKFWCFANRTKTIDVRNCTKLKSHMQGRIRVDGGTFNDGNQEWTFTSFAIPYDFLTGEPLATDDDIDFYFDEKDTIIGSYTSIDKIKISKENFPDANFRDLAKSYDEDHDGYLNKDELNLNVLIYPGDLCNDATKLRSMVGIGYFSSLQYLTVVNHKLEALDLSQNTELKYLTCYGNRLKELDLSKNTAMKELNCKLNWLRRLEIDGTFAKVNARSEYAQSEPYKPLVEVLETDQTFFDFEGVEGTVVALYCPEYMKELNKSERVNG